MRLSVDVEKFIKEKGGVSETARWLSAKGFSVTRQGVARWQRAGIIPMQSWLRILDISGGSLDLRNYLRREG